MSSFSDAVFKQYPSTSKIYKELAFPAPWANLCNTWSIHIDCGHAAMYAGRKQVACTQRSRKGSLSSGFCRCDSRRCTVPRNATSKHVNCLCKVVFVLFRASSSADIGIACPKFKAQFWRDTWMKVDFWYINNAHLRYVREMCAVQLLWWFQKKHRFCGSSFGTFIFGLFGTAMDGGHQQLRSCRRA